jgi:hypothetical protein
VSRRRIRLGDKQIAWHRCPGCGTLMDGATHIDGPPIDPDDGDPMICAYCGCLGVWDSTVEGSVRLPTGDEDTDMRADENVALALDVTAEMIRKRST